jgi:chromosome segregation protein
MTSPMRLRRLEVQGFKSFATRTVFEFGPGITAIVGPNGSGKSNLADAIRWVLGEQNPRTMRLRRLEDVIFAGGGKRAQAGLAEVSIVLDNTEGWLPIEFGEVVVTRRLHRSGESEYLLNRRKVRLRDILDMFLKARLGQNSYAILGQGMVDMVLSLRPEERRLLIEEAADVRRHRLKIDEALDQLAATRDNRDRVDLLLAEISPRLAQLERQVQRASEHAALSRDLAEHLGRLYGNRLLQTRAAAERAERSYAAAVEQTEESQRALETAEQALSAARSEAGVAANDAHSLELQHRETEEQQLAVERSLRDASGRIPLLEARLSEIERDLQALEREEQALANSSSETVSPSEGLEAAGQAVNEAERELSHASATAERAKADLESCERSERELLTSHVASRHEFEQRQSDRRRLSEERERIDQRRSSVLARLRSWAIEFSEAQESRATTERRLQTARLNQAEQGRRTEMARAALSKAQQDLTEIYGNLERTARRLEMLEGEQESRRPAEDLILALLDALRGGGPGRPRVLGILGGLIHVQRGYEVAIEAALAEGLNGLVVRTEREALGAVNVLQQIEGGRLGFFVLEGLRGAHPLNISSEHGIVGVASRFVRCDDEYRDLIDSLLGRVIIVEDLEAARRIVRRGLGSAVTLDGTLFRSPFVLSGGRGKADGQVFEADRLIGDLREEVATLEAQHAEAQEHVKRLNDQSSELGARLGELTEVVEDLLGEIARYDKLLATLSGRFEPIRGELEWIRQSTKDMEAQREALIAEHEALPSDGLPDEAAALAEATRQALEEFNSADKAKAEAAARLAKADGERAALLSEQAAVEALHRSRIEALQRTKNLKTIRVEAAQATTADLQAARELVLGLTATLEERRSAVAGAAGRLEAGRERARSLSLKLQESSEAVTRLRDQLAGQERSRLESELRLARTREDAERLQVELQAEGLSEEVVLTTLDGAAASATSAQELNGAIRDIRRRIREIGAVNEEAEGDYRESKERFDFLSAQVADLHSAELSLLEAIDELRQIVREQFRSTFQAINADFQIYFRTFFGGGQARLALAEPEDYGESGVDIIAQPPGKRLQNLAMLSGGERSMTAVALLFALLESNPAPFCVLDEVDAALDEANVGRFSDALARLAGRSQFLVITHNRGTVQAADQIYGVSMAGDGVSNVLSMRLSEAAPLLA